LIVVETALVGFMGERQARKRSVHLKCAPKNRRGSCCLVESLGDILVDCSYGMYVPGLAEEKSNKEQRAKTQEARSTKRKEQAARAWAGAGVAIVQPHGVY
jgi:hypothetical protein